MRAHLARHARRVLVQHPRSPSCALYSVPTRRRQLARQIVFSGSRRTFFDDIFSRGPPREVRQPDFEPGWMKIMVWRSRMLDNLRPPPTNELVQSWRDLFKAKLSSRVPLNSSQAMQCHRLLDYLLEQSPETPEKSSPKLTREDLIDAFNALRSLRTRERTPYHLNFTKRIYSALTSDTSDTEPDAKLWSQYLQTICLYGGSNEALEILYSRWDDVAKLGAKGKTIVLAIARALSREELESELRALLKDAETNGIPFDAEMQAVVVSYFAEKNKVAETKYWVDKSIGAKTLSRVTYLALASFALRNDLKDWAVPYFLKLGDQNPTKRYWDTLLHAVLVLGQGLKQVDAMMSRMAGPNGRIEPDIQTINGLLRAAAGLGDHALAEDILLLAEEKGIKPDGETYLIQMRLRLQAGYLPGVRTALRNVKKLEPWHSNHNRWWEYCELLNQYLEALCSEPTPDFKLLSELLQSAEEDQVQLEPQTVASLCVKFMENEQPFDVMDTLSVHAFQFSAAERDIVQEAFVQFCLNPETSTSRAWTTYQLLRQFFQDLSFDRRVNLVSEFFRRKRPDMASHVFGHMRQHRNNDYHPKLETYVTFFESLGEHPDTEALEMVFNMFKMDTTLQPNTRLYTSLIIAHTACDKALQAWDFWTEITSSREGPSYASLEAVFWALEHKAGGAILANKVWKKIESMEVDITPPVYNAYVGAIAAGAKLDELQDTILRMKQGTDVELDATTLGVAFNALPGQELQEQFKSWAKMRFPDCWAELEKKGKRSDENLLCKFKLKRVLKA